MKTKTKTSDKECIYPIYYAKTYIFLKYKGLKMVYILNEYVT